MRKPIALSVMLFLGLLAAAGPVGGQQDRSKRLSPPASAECRFADGKTIKVDYSSPRMRGRKIFGGLVPYGQIWRTGANEATTFVTDADLTVGGKSIPAGSYTIYTIPNEEKWTLILSKKTGQWGIPYPGESSDLLRADMQVSKVTAPVENFTVSFAPAGNSCTLNLEWELTRASVEFARSK